MNMNIKVLTFTHLKFEQPLRACPTQGQRLRIAIGRRLGIEAEVAPSIEAELVPSIEAELVPSIEAELVPNIEAVVLALSTGVVALTAGHIEPG